MIFLEENDIKNWRAPYFSPKALYRLLISSWIKYERHFVWESMGKGHHSAQQKLIGKEQQGRKAPWLSAEDGEISRIRRRGNSYQWKTTCTRWNPAIYTVFFLINSWIAKKLAQLLKCSQRPTHSEGKRDWQISQMA